MPIFGKKVTAEELAAQFLEENKGEFDLAFFSRTSGAPFAMPLAKFKGWVDSKGHNQPIERLSDALQSILHARLTEAMSSQS